MSKVSVCIDVSEMEKAIQFYTKALGCELVEEGEEYTELSADGLKVYLAKRETGSNPLIEGKAVRNFNRHWTPIHLDFTVLDVNQCVSLIIEMGGVKEGEHNGDWGSAAFCADPFGNGFCVMRHNN